MPHAPPVLGRWDNLTPGRRQPCDPETLAQTLEAGIRKNLLVTAEKQLLEQTIKGTLEVLVELLGILAPISFGRAQTMAELTQCVARDLAMPTPWVLGSASILSQIGILIVPDSLVAKLHTGGFFNSKEREIAYRVPEIGSNLLKRIPLLEQVAEAIYYVNNSPLKEGAFHYTLPNPVREFRTVYNAPCGTGKFHKPGYVPTRIDVAVCQVPTGTPDRPEAGQGPEGRTQDSNTIFPRE